MVDWNLCSSPPGYSERDYDGYTGVDGDPSSPYGYHNHRSSSCDINFGWVRSGTGAPTYARIDFTRSGQVSDPRLEFDASWSYYAFGDFSWGAATVGIGEPGVGDAALTGPAIGVEISGERDVIGTTSRSYRGFFMNAAGTIHATGWVPFTFSGGTSDTGVVSFETWVDGSTGWVHATNAAGTHDETRSIALTGSFLGGYDRWESYHGGGGGSGSNGGDSDPTGTQKAAFGQIRSIRVAELGGWRIGGIGPTW